MIPPVDAVPLRIEILQVDNLAVDSDQSCAPSCQVFELYEPLEQATEVVFDILDSHLRA